MITDEQKLEALRWLFNTDTHNPEVRGTGRSKMIAQVIVEMAKNSPNEKLSYIDHELRERHVKYGKDIIRRWVAEHVNNIEDDNDRRKYTIGRDYIIYHS